jgi:RND family efflux transporter MFP subunit
LARAQAGVAAARGGVAEASAMREYGQIRAPFAGVVTQRLVDPGALAAPGTPLITVQQTGTLRVTALVPPSVALGLRRGADVTLRIEGVPAEGTIEGVVASASSGLYEVNALVRNADGLHASGGAATMSLPGEPRAMRLIPAAAVHREGDLTGVRVRENGAVARRLIRVGRTRGSMIEVLSGLEVGDVVLVPAAASGSAAGRSVQP